MLLSRLLLSLIFFCVAYPVSVAEESQQPLPEADSRPKDTSQPEATPRISPTVDWAELALIWDNDLFSSYDDGYTNGGMVIITSDQAAALADVPGAALIEPTFGRLLGMDLAERQHQVSLSLSQRLYTPQDLSSTQPAPAGEQPYAALLYGGLSVASHGQRRFDSWTLHLGIMGPEALGKEVQTEVHRLTDSTRPRGWDTQIGTGFLANLTYERRQRWWDWEDANGQFGADLLAGFEVAFGSITTNVSFRGALRWGWHVPQDFYLPPSFMGESRMGALPHSPSSNWSLYALLAADATLVLYAAQWDGRWGETLQLERRASHLRLHAGFQGEVGNLGLGLLLTLPSIPWEDVYDRQWDGYASINAWYRF